MRFFLITSMLLLCQEAVPTLGDVGTASSYDPPYIPTKCYGDSKYQFPANNMFAAVSESLWNNGAACGRMYRIRCLSGHGRPCKDGVVDVLVVDECSTDPCPSNILLSITAFMEISHKTSSNINIEFTII
ncbi:hypothetical protein KFK09_027655 [Dendrobium nobile]|uniref:Expansin-like EG45 domain-containing protein n=1 Tax=Dendrobium nobile TaxID=94219 RepID=A0A8T3A1B6_DENNO|nr:hypothetical protein KFK09_027655 [Dendrobium nobile]